MLAGCDVYRPAAGEQLRTLCEGVGMPVVVGEHGDDPVRVAIAAVKGARARGCDVVVVDTAGRLQIDERMMNELGRLQKKLVPSEVLLVADAMTGQEAVNIAQGFDRKLGVTGIVLTKLDGDARGGAALSIRGVTGKPIKFVGVGEGLDDLERVDPQRLAGRILQMGDVVGLVERAQRSIDADAQARIEDAVLGKGRFTLEDFLMALRQVQAMGPLEQLMKMIPGIKAQAAGGQRRSEEDQARRSHYPVHDPRGAARASPARPLAAHPHRAGQRPAGIGDQPAVEAIQGNAEIDEADAGARAFADSAALTAPEKAADNERND